MSEERSSKVKKSIILSGLVGTGGLFVAKALGLVYSIPFSSILQSDAYMSYYGTAYRIYSYILNVFTAGFPFAISTLVARYTVSGDSIALKTIKKISLAAMLITGTAGMLLMILFSGMLANLIAPGEDVTIMATVLRILAAAIFFVPLLSAFRGFYQGRREMQEYAFSQAFEQLFRVAFLLSTAYLAVYVMGKERKIALYLAVMSTSIAAIAGLLQIFVFDRKKYPEILKEAEVQTTATQPQSVLIGEFISLAVPYLLVAVLGYADDIFNSVILPLGLRMHGYSQQEMNVILSAFNYVGTKLTAIPMILAPGFTSALIPHIATSMAEKDSRKVASNIYDCLDTVLFVGLPVAFCIFLYAEDAYQILFYTNDVAASSGVIRWIWFEGFMGTIAPIVTNIMMTLGLRKDVLKRLAVTLLIKAVIMVPLIMWIGYPGTILATVLAYGYLVIFNLRQISRTFGISFRKVGVILLRTAIATAVMTGVCFGLKAIGLNSLNSGRMIGLLKIVVNLCMTTLSYLLTAYTMKVPQMVFHRKFTFRRIAKKK